MAETFNKPHIARIRNSWRAIDKTTRSCATKRLDQTIDQLVEQCIDANDRRVVPHIKTCRKKAEKARLAYLKRKQDMANHWADEVRTRNQYRKYINKYGQDIANNIVLKKVTKGMEEEPVREAFGTPIRVETIPPDFKIWIYKNKRVSFSGGSVTFVDSRR